MPSKLRTVTYRITQSQWEWIEEVHERTGLPRSEIVRRAIDGHQRAEIAYEERRYLTASQRREVRGLARRHNMSFIDTVQEAFQSGIVRLQEKPIRIG